MVSFQCDACADIIKKPKLDQHRARCNASFTCIDCSKTFPTPVDWKGHTSCISEAEKYQKSLYKPKQNGGGRENGRMTGSGGKFRGQRGSWNKGLPRSQATGANGTPLGTPTRMSPVVAPSLTQDSKSPPPPVPAPANGADSTARAQKKRKSEPTVVMEVEDVANSISLTKVGTTDEKDKNGKEKKDKKGKGEKKEKKGKGKREEEKEEKGEKRGKAERKKEKAKQSETDTNETSTSAVPQVKAVRETKELTNTEGTMVEHTEEHGKETEVKDSQAEKKKERKEKKGKKRKREAEAEIESATAPEASKIRDDDGGVTLSPAANISQEEIPKKSKKPKKNAPHHETNVGESREETGPDSSVPDPPPPNQASGGEEKKKKGKRRKSELGSGEAEVITSPQPVRSASPHMTEEKANKRKREVQEGNVTEQADAGDEKKKKRKKATATAAS